MHCRLTFEKILTIKIPLNFHYIFFEFNVTDDFINFTMFILNIAVSYEP